MNSVTTPMTPHYTEGTYLKAWDLIKMSGLDRMGRNEIHMASGLHGALDLNHGFCCVRVSIIGLRLLWHRVCTVLSTCGSVFVLLIKGVHLPAPANLSLKPAHL
jgi:hypothetical protein